MAKKPEVSNASYEQKMKELEKKFGKGSLISFKEVDNSLEVVDSGSIALNEATAVGGIPIGKLIEIMGPESSGKSTLTLEIIAQFQKAGKRCALIDSEHSFDSRYAKAVGVQVEKLIISQPECMEEGYDIVEALIRMKEFGLVVVDSHTALLPKKVVDGDMGDATIGLQARLNSIGIGKIKPLLLPNNCTMIAISQLRTNIGGYGDPNVATGGNAYKFYSDMRMKVSRQNDKEGQESKTTVEVIKNKCGVPFKKGSFNIVWGEGIDKMREIMDYAVNFDLLTKGGSWYTLENGSKVQGDDAMKQFLQDNEEYYLRIKSQVLKMLKGDTGTRQESEPIVEQATTRGLFNHSDEDLY